MEFIHRTESGPIKQLHSWQQTDGVNAMLRRITMAIIVRSTQATPAWVFVRKIQPIRSVDSMNTNLGAVLATVP